MGHRGGEERRGGALDKGGGTTPTWGLLTSAPAC